MGCPGKTSCTFVCNELTVANNLSFPLSPWICHVGGFVWQEGGDRSTPVESPPDSAIIGASPSMTSLGAFLLFLKPELQCCTALQGMALPLLLIHDF